jgi:hypothetical protein
MRRLLGIPWVTRDGYAGHLASTDGDRSVPLKGTFTGAWDNVIDGLFAPPANFEGGGNITHIGNATWSLTLFLEPTHPNFLAPGLGTGTIVAANGDVVFVEYEGELNVATGKGSGTFMVMGGTGRFARATGQGTLTASIDLSVPSNQEMTSTIDGTISY